MPSRGGVPKAFRAIAHSLSRLKPAEAWSIPAAGEHGGKALHGSACTPLDEPVTGGAWVGKACSPACSQNESGGPIILREPALALVERAWPLQTASKFSLHQCGNKLTVFPPVILHDSNK